MKEITVHIEIPKGSNIKYEYNRKTNQIEVDRILRKGFFYPANYGFIKEALDWDGDELDVLVYSDATFLPGIALKARVIGAMKMIDDGETDTKIIAVHANDYRCEAINDIRDLPAQWLDSVATFFATYKNWKRPGITSVSGFENKDYAVSEYKECVRLMQRYGQLDKKVFIKKMRQERPDKYE